MGMSYECDMKSQVVVVHDTVDTVIDRLYISTTVGISAGAYCNPSTSNQLHPINISFSHQFESLQVSIMNVMANLDSNPYFFEIVACNLQSDKLCNHRARRRPFPSSLSVQRWPMTVEL